MKELALISIDDFSQLLNQNLNIQFNPAVILPAEVIEVTKLNGYTPLDRSSFSVVLRTSQKAGYYQQASYVLEHPTKGELLIFLVPLGLDPEGMKYEAIFS